MVKGWAKDGNRQAIPTLCPGNGVEGWTKGGRKVGIVRQSPPYAQAMGDRVDKRWTKDGESQATPTLSPYTPQTKAIQKPGIELRAKFRPKY